MKSVYRRLPVAFRNRVSAARAVHFSKQFKFRRTSRWRRRVAATPAPKPLGEYRAAGGVNVFAYVRGQFGLAEGARAYIRALLDEGYPVSIHDIDVNVPHAMNDRSLNAYVGGAAPYVVNMLFVNPDYLSQAIASIGSKRLSGRRTIACWFWELEKFPDEWRPALQMVDEVMVSTAFIRDSVSSVTDKPVWCVPLPIGVLPDSGLGRLDFGLEEDSFVFLTNFDFNSYLARKNPFAAIMAFQLAFPKEKQGVQLLIKSTNGHRHPDELRMLVDAVGDDKRILIRDEMIDREDFGALQRCVDACVSLHRSEGFGLGLAECMRLAKPVVATAWSGNMDFMTAANSCLVSYRLVSIRDGEYPHATGQHWAEANVDHAAQWMRRLVEDPALACQIGQRAARDIQAKLSAHDAAREIIKRIEPQPPRSTLLQGITGCTSGMGHRNQKL